MGIHFGIQIQTLENGALYFRIDWGQECCVDFNWGRENQSSFCLFVNLLLVSKKENRESEPFSLRLNLAICSPYL